MYIVKNKEKFMSKVFARKDSPLFADFISKMYYIKRKSFVITIVALAPKFISEFSVPKRYVGFEIYSFFGNNLLCGVLKDNAKLVPLFQYEGDFTLDILYGLLIELYSVENFRV